MSGWAIVVCNWPQFSIERADASVTDIHSAEVLNGVHPTRLAAIEEVTDNLEVVRRELAVEIARAKRMRRAALTPTAANQGKEGRCR